MHPHFVDQSFAQEICFLFIQMHVVGVTQRRVHDDKRMKGQIG